jgi:uncharacterized BrkB/YihY/UPF0761 family membrane protein
MVPIPRRLREDWERARQTRAGRVATVVGEEWSGHQVSRNVAAITFYGLLSLFPLLHLFQFALDVANELSPELADSMGEALSDDLAVLGDTGVAVDEASGISLGGIVAAVFGLPLALWGATRAFSTLFAANDEIWNVSDESRITGAKRRAASVAGVAVFAVRVVVVALAAILASFVGGAIGWSLVVAAEFAANLWVVFGLMRIGSSRQPWSVLWPGVVGAAIGFAALQLWGAVLARQWSSDASSTHAATVGLLAVMWGHVLVLQVATSLTATRQVLLDRAATHAPADTAS